MNSLALICIVLFSYATIGIQGHAFEPYNDDDLSDPKPTVPSKEQQDDKPAVSAKSEVDELAANFFDDNEASEMKVELEEVPLTGSEMLKQEDAVSSLNQELKKETTDFEPKDFDETNQNEVSIDLNEEPVELNKEQLNDVTSEGFSEVDQDFDKATSKVQFQALIKSQSQKCTCYCRQGGERSCAEIRRSRPNSYSGYYKIVNNQGREVQVYCHMGRLCGIDGGWRRLVRLDMTTETAKCPPALKLVTVGSTKLCTRPNSGGGCTSVNICPQGVNYTYVCGHATGYQFGSTDGAHAYHYRSKSINGPYIDGVSLTRGSPRQHIFTYISALSETQRADCPCSPRGPQPPSFVGSNYYCESGFKTSWPTRFAVEDPLWDRKQCNNLDANCCTNTRMPWFYRDMGTARADKLEVRLCTDENTSSENVALRDLSVFVM